MTGVLLFVLLLAVVASALYSGSEIGFYSLSRVRVDLEARQGHTAARIVSRLVRDESALLITILIGNNLAIELASHIGHDLFARQGVPSAWLEVVLTLVLAPVLFFFGEVLPKDLFHRRPHGLTGAAAPFILVSRIVFWPLERVLRGVTLLLERGLGLEARAVMRFRGREALLHYLAEGKRSGALPARAEVLAQNALKLRSVPLSRAMVPWSEVVCLAASADPDERLRLARESRFSRLPVVGDEGEVLGYVHQLDLLLASEALGPLEGLRPIPCLPASTPVDRALLTLRGGAQRAMVVGTAEAPEGLVTLKDLVEEISGDLVGL